MQRTIPRTFYIVFEIIIEFIIKIFTESLCLNNVIKTL